MTEPEAVRSPEGREALPPVVCIVGPTASGKTAAALRLAERFRIEVVSADSMQLYRGMDVGTAKPTAEERRRVPHHMIDVCDPSESMSVVRYAEMARRAVREIHGRGALPVIVGGTGQYVNAVIRDENFAPAPEDGALRQALEDYAREAGAEALHARLREKDPDSAARIHPNNVKRVVRALEIIELTGSPLGAVYAGQPRPRDVFRALMVGLEPVPRAFLYARIDARVDEMLAGGLVEEARALFARGFSETSLQAIAYKELLPFLSGERPLAETADELRRRTRNYAKRQLTWFRNDGRVRMLTYADAAGYEECLQSIGEMVGSFTGEVYACRSR